MKRTRLMAPILILASLTLIYNDQGTITVTRIDNGTIYARGPSKVIWVDFHGDKSMIPLIAKYVEDNVKVGNTYHMAGPRDIYINGYKLSELVYVDVLGMDCWSFSSLKDRCH